MARDETAWTWWTLPPRSLGAWPRGTTGTRRFCPIRAGLARTLAIARLWRPAGCLLVASGYQERRGPGPSRDDGGWRRSWRVVLRLVIAAGALDDGARPALICLVTGLTAIRARSVGGARECALVVPR